MAQEQWWQGLSGQQKVDWEDTALEGRLCSMQLQQGYGCKLEIVESCRGRESLWL